MCGVQVHMHVHLCICMDVYLHVCLHAHVYACACVCEYLLAYTPPCMRECAYGCGLVVFPVSFVRPGCDQGLRRGVHRGPAIAFHLSCDHTADVFLWHQFSVTIVSLRVSATGSMRTRYGSTVDPGAMIAPNKKLGFQVVRFVCWSVVDVVFRSYGWLAGWSAVWLARTLIVTKFLTHFSPVFFFHLMYPFLCFHTFFT